jgi:hypothetical protein
MGQLVWSSRKREQVTTPPDYIRILKLDKLAMKSKTLAEFRKAVKSREQYAKNLGVQRSFPYLVEHAWLIFGNGK